MRREGRRSSAGANPARQLSCVDASDVLDTRLLQAQTEQMAPIDLVAALVNDELQRRQDRLLARRHKQARFRDADRSLDGFDFAFNKKINRALVFELATARFIDQREDVLLIGPPGTGKSHIAQAIGRAAIQQGYRVIYREAHTFLEELAEATLADTRKAYLGVAPISWTPILLASRRRRSPRCRNRDRRIRRHSDSRWSSWFGPGVHRESWLGSSSRRPRRYETGSRRRTATPVSAPTV